MELTTAYKSREISTEDFLTAIANSRAVLLNLFVVIKGYKPKGVIIPLFLSCYESELNVKSAKHSVEHILCTVSHWYKESRESFIGHHFQ